MNTELLVALLEGFVFYGIIYSLLFMPLRFLKQHYVRKLCKYRGTTEQPGRACVVCSYNNHCNRVKKSKEYENYLYWRKMVPEKGKAMYDEIWEEEHQLLLKNQKNSLSPFVGVQKKKADKSN